MNDATIDLKDGTRIIAATEPGRERAEGPVLVLLAGTWGNAETRGEMVARLDPRIGVVHVSLPGQDDNWPPPRPERMSIERFSGHVLLAADTLGPDRFYVGGNSLGGMIAIDMLRLCPGRLLGAVAVEGWTHHSVSQNVFGGDVGSTLSDTQRAQLDEARSHVLDRWPDDLRAAYGSMWRKWSGYDTLAATDLPVLELWGDRGRERPSRERMLIPDRPNIALEWFAGCSHSLLVECPEQVAESISRFVLSGAARGPGRDV